MSIRRLPPEIADKIAAGEVIERPASVVKELVENALDAGATRVVVEAECSGKDLIRVTDDGHGILAAEIEVAVERHSTSKLTSVDDLSRVRTLGFRGEALASVAAVADLTLASVTEAGSVGRRVQAGPRGVAETEPFGGPVGTQVTVRGLFHSLPARLEFLKTDRTELAHVINVVTHAAIGYPQVAFRLLDGDQERLRTKGEGDLRTTLLALYGKELVDGLIELPPGQTLGIDGFVSQPHLHRPARSYISLFVNRRWVGDRLLSGAISEAYRSLLPARRFPVVVLRLTLPPEEVDVNVHPTKAEVRFRRSGEVFGRVSAAVRRALMASGEAAQPTLEHPVVDQFFFPTGLRAGGHGSAPATARTLGADGSSRSEGPPDDGSGAVDFQSPVMRPLGQIDHTYIIAAGPRGLYLIDQHAAHERVLYERFLSAGNGSAQPLLDPAPVELTPDESAWVDENLDRLRTHGLEVEPFGPSTWLVRSVPATRRAIAGDDYLRGVVGELQRPEVQRLEATEQVRWSMACRAAVRAGDKLALDEMRALIDRLQECDLGLACPHGRPTVILLSREMLDREFGRA